VFRHLLSRFLLTQAILIVLPCGVVLAMAWSGGGHWRWAIVGGWAIVAVGLAIIASVFLAQYWLRDQLRITAALLTDAVPAALAKVPSTHPGDNDLTALQDIVRTLQVLMEEASKDQAQLRTIIASMSDGLIATDHLQRILMTNKAAADLLAFRTTTVKGKLLWEVVPIEPVLKAVTEVSLTGQQKTIAAGPVEGKHLAVTVCRLPLRPAGFVIVARDVTETTRYEELRKEFVANVSHELRTPLTVIKGYVETLADGAIDDRTRAMAYLGTVSKHTEHLTNLVNDLLSLSRLDSSSTIPNQRPVRLEGVANKVAELMAPAAQKKGHRLALEIADGMSPVIGNAEYLERAVLNLVDNALKYTKENGVVKLVARTEDGQSIIEVIDNGLGIAAEDLPRIFERFYRVDRSRSRDMGGTGLGLSIVKHIVAAHGGTVEVSSMPGAGSTFRIKLPAVKDRGEASVHGNATSP